ncbi:2'-5' RNA ligase family protein [Kribbella sp. NPDC050470]|uniref:2'-5' RNA ligase family protein n=1 Tax=unclassified Kribbella TaxID=2644121 RepID=UPI003790E838
MLEEVRDHWYWRPGWRPDRSFYAWHVTFDGRPEIAALHASYGELLNDLPGFTPVPLEWLHLGLQGVGFTDRVPDADLADIVEATRRRFTQVASFPVTVGPAELDAESIQLPVRPTEPLQHLRDLTRAAITDVWGDDAVPELPELNPHITLAYCNHNTPTAPITTRLLAHTSHSTALSITTLTLLTLTRTHHLYHWKPDLSLDLD